MVDVVPSTIRSRMMSGIKGKNTLPEIQIRKCLHALGFRFRLHRKDLPGKPDIVLPKYRLVIFVHGCFWHRHQGCFYATSPATRKDFWKNKLDGNHERDLRQQKELEELGWRVAIIWECGLRHKIDDMPQTLLEIINGNAVLNEWPTEPPRVRD